jgi:hypothetical protein
MESDDDPRFARAAFHRVHAAAVVLVTRVHARQTVQLGFGIDDPEVHVRANLNPPGAVGWVDDRPT